MSNTFWINNINYEDYNKINSQKKSQTFDIKEKNKISRMKEGDKIIYFLGDKGVFVGISEVKNDKYEQEVERMLNEIKKFLQREYKSVTGNGITLRKKGEPQILVQSTSRVRTFVQAYQHYTISGMKNIDQILEPSVASEKEVIKNFLSQVSNKRPQNDTRKKG